MGIENRSGESCSDVTCDSQTARHLDKADQYVPDAQLDGERRTVGAAVEVVTEVDRKQRSATEFGGEGGLSYDPEDGNDRGPFYM